MRTCWAVLTVFLSVGGVAGQPPAVVKVRTIGKDNYGRVTRAEFGSDPKLVYAVIGTVPAAYDLSTGEVRAEYKAFKNTFGPVVVLPKSGDLVRGFFQSVEISGPADTTFAKVRLRCEDEVKGLAVSPDGKLVAGVVWKTNSVELWDVPAGKRLHVLRGSAGAVAGVAFSLDSKSLASVDTTHAVTVWDVATGKANRRLEARPGRKGVGGGPLGYSPDGKTLYGPGAGATQVVAWDPATGRKVWETDNPKKSLDGSGHEFDSLAVHPGGKYLVASTADGDGKTWVFLEAAGGKVIGEHKVSRRAGDGAPRFSPDGKWIALSTFHGIVEVYEVK
ncbi:MAG: WD40 repeat domain-containing protein [Gemmataceae bacterium]